ncbi:MAG: BON domain-containing protein [Gammaproteobacteria bacterium]|nr:BON domain-containing protein [Gammaproteobacteria bacterium]
MSIIRFLKLAIVSICLLFSGSVFADEMSAVSATAAPTDTSITNTVNTTFESSNALKGSKINVSTLNGVVSLSGDVNSNDQAYTAVSLAQSIPAVKDVDASRLTVKGSQHLLSDSLITAKIKGLFIQEKIFGDKDIATLSIHVETNNGVVSLSGTADNQTQIDTAKTIASAVSGVKDVKTNVQISG